MADLKTTLPVRKARAGGEEGQYTEYEVEVEDWPIPVHFDSGPQGVVSQLWTEVLIDLQVYGFAGLVGTTSAARS